MIKTVDPWSGNQLAAYPIDTAENIAFKIDQSQQAYLNWRQTTLAHKARSLLHLASLLESEQEAAARLISLEMGKPLTESLSEIEKCIKLIRLYSQNAPLWLANETIKEGDEAATLIFQPLGIILGIMPWNFPFWQAFRFIIPTITAGNAVIVKHASNVSGSALFIQNLFNEASFEKHLVQVVFLKGAEVLPLIAHRHIKGVSVTGSEAAGAAAASLAAKHIKPAVLELGGSDPMLIFEDILPETAAKAATKGRMINGGQSCIATKRLILHTTIYKQTLELLIQVFQQLRLGNPLLPETDIGPMAQPHFVQEMDDLVKDALDKGAKLYVGGKPDASGRFFLPTLLGDIKPGMRLWEEECFGPVLQLIGFDTIEQAIELANQTQFGLGASVWTNNKIYQLKCANEIEAGTIAINDQVKSNPAFEFGGIKKSGFGRELGKGGIRSFVNIKTINGF